MSLRTWAVFALLTMGLILDFALIRAEPKLEKEAEEQVLDFDVLATLGWRPSNRRKDLQDMGLNEQLAGAVMEQITRLDRKKNLFFTLFRATETDTQTVAQALCKRAGIGLPYSALEVLVKKAGRATAVIDDQELSLVAQDWYQDEKILIEERLYPSWERTKDRRPDATVVVIAAILGGHGELAFSREDVWGTRIAGFPYTIDGILKKYRALTPLVVDYFAMLHFMVELANDPDRGVCE